MAKYVTDTHALIWFLDRELAELGIGAQQAFQEAEDGRSTIYVPSISCVEMDVKGDNPLKPRHVPLRLLFRVLADIHSRQESYKLVPLDERIILNLSHIKINSVPDPHDRIIAATALALQLPLITRDKKLVDCAKEVQRLRIVWDSLDEPVLDEESDKADEAQFYE